GGRPPARPGAARPARRAPPSPHRGEPGRRQAHQIHARGPDALPGGEEVRAMTPDPLADRLSPHPAPGDREGWSAWWDAWRSVCPASPTAELVGGLDAEVYPGDHAQDLPDGLTVISERGGVQ